MVQQVVLLVFEYFQVFVEDFFLVFVNVFGECLVVGLEVVCYVLEVLDGSGVFWGDEVDYDVCCFVFCWCLVVVVVGVGYVDFDQYVVGWCEVVDLLVVYCYVVGQVVVVQSYVLEWWGYDILYVVVGDYFVVFYLCGWCGFVDFFLVDVGCMDIGFVGQVYQVIDYQVIVVVDVVQFVVIGLIGVFCLFQVGYQCGVGLFFCVWLDLDEVVLFLYWEVMDVGEVVDLLVGYCVGVIVFVYCQVVVVVDQYVVFDEVQ